MTQETDTNWGHGTQVCRWAECSLLSAHAAPWGSIHQWFHVGFWEMEPKRMVNIFWCQRRWQFWLISQFLLGEIILIPHSWSFHDPHFSSEIPQTTWKNPWNSMFLMTKSHGNLLLAISHGPSKAPHVWRQHRSATWPLEAPKMGTVRWRNGHFYGDCSGDFTKHLVVVSWDLRNIWWFKMWFGDCFIGYNMI